MLICTLEMRGGQASPRALRFKTSDALVLVLAVVLVVLAAWGRLSDGAGPIAWLGRIAEL